MRRRRLKHRSRWRRNGRWPGRFGRRLRLRRPLRNEPALFLQLVNARGKRRNLFCQPLDFILQAVHARTLLHLFSRHQVPDCAKFRPRTFVIVGESPRMIASPAILACANAEHAPTDSLRLSALTAILVLFQGEASGESKEKVKP